MNTSRVYRFSKIGDITSFHVCEPQMKLDICICFVESTYPSCKNEQWMREMKQLSLALSASNEDPNIHYSRIGVCFKKLAARAPKSRTLLITGLFRTILCDTSSGSSTKITSEERQKSKKQAGKNKSKKK